MLANGGRTGQRFPHDETVVEAPEKIGCDEPVERVHVAVQQGARKTLEQFISFGWRWSHDRSCP